MHNEKVATNDAKVDADNKAKFYSRVVLNVKLTKFTKYNQLALIKSFVILTGFMVYE